MPGVLPELSDADARKGVVTHSSGNHAQALALAAKLRGIPAHIVMPKNATPVKRRAVEGYGANVIELSQRAAIYVDRILSGARPADLPVERAERFEMTINLRTLQALNLILPQSLLLQATEVVS